MQPQKNNDLFLFSALNSDLRSLHRFHASTFFGLLYFFVFSLIHNHRQQFEKVMRSVFERWKKKIACNFWCLNVSSPTKLCCLGLFLYKKKSKSVGLLPFFSLVHRIGDALSLSLSPTCPLTLSTFHPTNAY